MAFNEITDQNELDNLFAESGKKAVVLFKHSLTCPISYAAYEEMSLMKTEAVNLIIVQDARHISNEIAERTGVRHESPQTIILRDGKPVWHASHYDITKSSVTRALEELKS
jgi:bacillithiol system protein YtxJ